jgi:eukaryotic-like serine/threonine-protein kinase
MKPGTLVGERFEIERVAGTGGMGAVYRARDRKSGEHVALKVITSREHHERFLREASVLAELRHPAIVRYIAHDPTYLAMEWIDGEDLDQRLGREALSIPDAITLGVRAAEALASAHKRGIVHRDVKPSNVLLPGGDPARAKLVDFGIARHNDAWRRATRTGMIVGTPGYMAPEQARGEANIDGRADIFALGCVLYECIAGTPAFVGEHPMAVLAKLVLEDVRPLRHVESHVPPALDALIMQMLAKNPSDRPGDAASIARELSSINTDDPRSSAKIPLSAPMSSAPRSIGGGEQRVLSVIMADAKGAAVDASARTMTPAELEAPQRSVVQPFGARLEPLAGGAAVAVLTESGAATDQAARAARCALALQRALPGAAIALATGRGFFADRLPVGEVIDRAVRLLRARTKGVAIDDVTAGLLDTRFEVSGDERALVLASERATVDATRTLLGKPTPCVGRDRELSTLRSVLDECREEPCARAVIVTGPAGIGKSRVRHELLKEAAGMELLIGRGDALSAGSPFGVIAPMIRRAAGVLDGEPNALARQKLRARFARHLAGTALDRVTTFLCEMVGAVAGEEDAQLRAARRDAMLMGDQMMRAFSDFIVAEASSAPLLMIIEDLHWGDAPSVRFIDAALRAAHDQPFMVLGLARPEVHDLFPKLWAERGAIDLPLNELSKKGSEKLVRAVLGDADPKLIDRIVDRAAGNAFYLEELIRAASSPTSRPSGDLPETVLAMVQTRLSDLDADARRVLRAASVFGQVFWHGGVAELLGDDRELRQRLDDLCEAEVFARLGTPRFPGEQELTFRHGLVREGAYAMLTDEDRAVGHRLAGEWLERNGERDAIVLAEHFQRGNEPHRAVQWYLQAAEQALEGNDLPAAIARASRGIDGGATSETLGMLLLIQAEAHGWRGEYQAGESLARTAMESLPRGSENWCRAAAEAITQSARLAKVDAVVALSSALAEVGEGAPCARAATQCLFAGKLDLVDKLVARIDPEDPRAQWIAALRAQLDGDAAMYLELSERALEGFEDIGDLRTACSARIDVGSGYLLLGAYDEAESTFRAALADAVRMGLGPVSAVLRAHLGLVLAFKGAFDEGKMLLESSIDTFRAQKSKRAEGATAAYLAICLLRAGDLGNAEKVARESSETLASAPLLRPQALGVLARILLACDRAVEALAVAREAAEAIDKLGHVEEGEATVRLALAEALYATGDVDAARAAIVAARDHLLGRAKKIGNEKWRASFLKRVEEHARTVTLANAWLG